ncbi:MAG: metallophosphoesterase [Clostridia bacterium]|nr:metallophosphoesterase [Clostridia bacterium]
MIPTPRKKLQFRRDGSFHVLMVSDFHAHDRCSPQLKEGLNALVEYTDPDLVLLGGDQLGAITPERLHNYLADVLEILETRGIPWAHVYGNHDHEQLMSAEEQEPVYEAFPCCVSERGPKDIHGVGNYVLPILSSDGARVAWNVWALDSLREYPDYQQAFGHPEYRYMLRNPFGPDCVQASALFDQVVWYYETSRRMEAELGYKPPAIMYMHVPILEMVLIQKNPLECGMVGTQRETIGCSELSNGLFMACQQRGDVKAMFFGHEHLNDFSGNLFGITMGYASALGYDMTTDDDMRGGREIVLSERDGGMTTRHIKLLDIMGDRARRRYPKKVIEFA